MNDELFVNPSFVSQFMHLLRDRLVLVSLPRLYVHHLRWPPTIAYPSRVLYPHDRHLSLRERSFPQDLELIRQVP